MGFSSMVKKDLWSCSQNSSSRKDHEGDCNVFWGDMPDDKECHSGINAVSLHARLNDPTVQYCS
jgi:hypothetical protein